ncbi:MAG: ATP-binding protein, partial [Moorea sp. SIO4G2]|nr:ATP-binding protein [Moorena sp. SIO4G2]
WEKTEDNQKKTNLNPFQSNTQRIINDRVKDFVGREFVFEAIDHFFSTESNGYFTIEADPGVGKSAILAKYVQQNNCLVHFNQKLEGVNRTSQFLENICTQLIERYNLSYKSLPADATRDGNFLGHLLNEVSTRLGEEEKVVIAVDALDEVDLASQDAGANILYLPPYLPDGVYFLLTRRRVTLPFVVHTPQHLFNLMEYFDESLQDVEEYIRRATRRKKLLLWIKERELTTEEFTEQLLAKSENNFMYLRYVLPQIEKGLYHDLSLESLPTGLQGYYENHWVRMGMTAKPLPRTKLKIVYVLGETHQPVSLRLISEYANEEQLTVQDVIDEWEQFLHEQPIDKQTCYSIYHASFQDFLHRKDIVQAASVDIEDINRMIADHLWEGLFGDE